MANTITILVKNIMFEVTIKKVEKEDILLLHKISTETFVETFSKSNSAENMQLYLDNELSLKKLSLELEDPNSVFYFAFLETKLVAYLKLNYGKSQKELQDSNAQEIERIYVYEEFQKCKIGQQLLNESIASAKINNCDYVWLGVWEKNEKAINI